MAMFETCYEQMKEVEAQMEILNSKGLNDEAEVLCCEMESTIQSLDDYVNFIALFDSYKRFRDNKEKMMTFDMLFYSVEDWSEIVRCIKKGGVRIFGIPKDNRWKDYCEAYGGEEWLLRIITGGLKINYVGTTKANSEYDENIDTAVFYIPGIKPFMNTVEVA